MTLEEEQEEERTRGGVAKEKEEDRSRGGVASEEKEEELGKRGVASDWKEEEPGQGGVASEKELSRGGVANENERSRGGVASEKEEEPGQGGVASEERGLGGVASDWKEEERNLGGVASEEKEEELGQGGTASEWKEEYSRGGVASEEELGLGGVASEEKEEEPRQGGVASEAEEEELVCGICCMPYDRCGRAPRRLGGGRGSWKPSRCRHVICSACVCQLAREGWWEKVTCPYCRAVTHLRERSHPLVAGVRRGSGAGRRRLVLPPIDAELWHRVARRQEQEEARRSGSEEEAEREAEAAEEKEEEDGDAEEEGQWRLWRALKKLVKGGSRAHAQSWRGRGRRSSLEAGRWRRAEPINPYGPDVKDLVLMTCYII
ncbi:RING finger protein 227 [Anolis sagrei]|uniref:RING finger protein 227 n=1 Tax=Anolis sagrei TaxID=38937 RepID=UPI00352232A2